MLTVHLLSLIHGFSDFVLVKKRGRVFSRAMCFSPFCRFFNTILQALPFMLGASVVMTPCSETGEPSWFSFLAKCMKSCRNHFGMGLEVPSSIPFVRLLVITTR